MLTTIDSLRRLPLPDLPVTQGHRHTQPVLDTLPVEACMPLLLQQIQADASSEYDLSLCNDKLEGFNPEHNLQSAFHQQGPRFTALIPAAPTLDLELVRYGYEGHLQPVPMAVLHGDRNRVEYRRGELVEWYVNGPLGIEQGFTLNTPPTSRQGVLTFEMSVQGVAEIISSSTGELNLLLPDQSRLTYGHLYATDAQGRLLPSSMEAQQQDGHWVIHLVVDDRDAVYPIVVDPLIQQSQKLTVPNGHDGGVAVAGNWLVYGAHVYSFNGTQWVYSQKLTASNGDTDFYGAAISGTTIVVGDLFKNSNTGVVYVFVYNGSSWVQQAQLTVSGIVAGDYFGEAVAIDGDTIAISTEFKNSYTGAVWVFTRSGTTWSLQATPLPADVVANDHYGVGLALQGDTLVVGAHFQSVSGQAEAGSAYVFTRSGTTWTQQQKLVASDPAPSTFFAVNISLQGDVVALGANNATNSGLSQLNGKGAVYIFKRNGTTWSQVQKITASNAAVGDRFGWVVKLYQSTLLVGTQLRDTAAGTNAGMAYLFTHNGQSFIEANQIVPSDATANDQFGRLGNFQNNTAFIASQSGLYVFNVTPSAPTNSGGPSDGLTWAGQPLADNSIALQTADKLEPVMDLSVQTAVGALDFVRTYRLQKRAAWQSALGVGWTHNHLPSLVITAGTPNVATIQLPNGGELVLKETAVTGTYASDNGSDALLKYTSGGNPPYVLEQNDGAKFNFDSAGKLLSRTWPGGHTWTYSYDGTGKLTTVADGTGRSLNLVYRNTPGQFDNGQLWRVGDNTAVNLSGTPSGRYVEYTYSPQKSNGVTVSNPKPLLTSVRDVLGKTWAYAYFGDTAGETSAVLLDAFKRSLSPTVDTTGQGGSGANMQAIEMESFTYSLTGSQITSIIHNRGNSLLATTYNFLSGTPQITEEITAGLTTKHRFENGVYVSVEDPNGNITKQAVGLDQRPMQVTDANGNNTLMRWSEGGELLVEQTDAVGAKTLFTYKTVGANGPQVLDTVTNPDGSKTRHEYDSTAANPRLPIRSKKYDFDGTTVLEWREFTYDTMARLTSEKQFNPAGTVLQRQVDYTYYGTTGNGALLRKDQTERYVQNGSFDATRDIRTEYTYDAIGRVIKTKRVAIYGRCNITFSVLDAANNVVANLCNYDPGVGADPTTVAAAIALYSASTPDKNRVTTYEFDARGRRVKTVIDAGASFARTDLVVYDALSRVVRTIANYVASGTIPDPFVHTRVDFAHGTDNDQNLVVDKAYNKAGLLRTETDELDNVTLYGYDNAKRLVKLVKFASNPTYNNDYQGGVSPDPKLISYTPSAAPDTDLSTSYVYDKAGNLIQEGDPIGNVTLTGYDALNRVVRVIRNASNPTYDRTNDPKLSAYTQGGGAGLDQDFITDTEYDKVGRVRRVRIFAAFAGSTKVEGWILTGYDGLGRVVKVVFRASNSTYNMDADPKLTSYASLGGAGADLDFITKTAYDEAGRVMYNEDTLGRRDWIAYDGFSRVRRKVDNAIGTATDYGTTDPRSDTYAASTTLFDQDQISLTEYDLSGRVKRTRDNLGNWTLFGYDSIDRTVRVIRNAVNATFVSSDGTLADYTLSTSVADQDILMRMVYDAKGRIDEQLDPLGKKVKTFYDTLDRVLKRVGNYVDGVFSAATPDEDLIVTTKYDVGGRTLEQVDPRGTKTAWEYDKAGRARKATLAAGTELATVNYTCFDKGGRVLREIQNWIYVATDPTPDAKDGSGNWLFAPAVNGPNNDQNLISTYVLDKAGRSVSVTNPTGDTSTMAYYKDGQVEGTTDPLGVVTKFRYDNARRLVLTVANFIANGEDPDLWKWNGTAWTKSNGTTVIDVGTAQDQNVLIGMEYDKAGRRTAMRDAKGNRTQFAFDQLNRPTSLTNPLNHVWQTSYTNQANGTMRISATNPLTQVTQADSDKLGRVATMAYLSESPKLTPDVSFTYDKAGNRLSMSESNGVATVRKANFGYDNVYRLKQVDFDNDGNNTIDETVSYGYDAGGLRTQLTLPGGLNVTYTYDAKGRLRSLTDWSSQAAAFSYDQTDRLRAVQRDNGVTSTYAYDPMGRLRLLRHYKGKDTQAEFTYKVDKRGNRTEAVEYLRTGTTGMTLDKDNLAVQYAQGTWTDAAPFKVSTNTNALARIAFAGDSITLNMGTGTDHGIYDVYIDGSLWQTIDGSLASPGNILLERSGPHVLEIRNRAEKNLNATGYKVRFQSLVVNHSYALNTWAYTYDALARLKTATQYTGQNTAGTAKRAYSYSFDVVGNRATESVALNGGAATLTTQTFDAANRISNAGYAYDAAGRLTSDGTNTYTWDRADRLLSMGTSAYKYNGLGQRIEQTVSAQVSKYLLDLSLGLQETLVATTGANVERYVHGPMGLFAQRDTANNWETPLADGLGSVRSVLDASASPLYTAHFAPYGSPFDVTGTSQTPFGFTGEPTDGNGLLYLRARYYAPGIGAFPILDQVMGVNRYDYVGGDPINRIDPDGRRALTLNPPKPVAPSPKLVIVPKAPVAAQPNRSGPVKQQTLSPLEMLKLGMTTHQLISSAINILGGGLNQTPLKAFGGLIAGGVGIAAHTGANAIGLKAPWQESAAVQAEYKTALYGGVTRANNDAISNTLKNAITNDGKFNMGSLQSGMEGAFGYTMQYGDPGSGNFSIESAAAKVATMRLLDASSQITGYLQEKIDPSKDGLATFREYFGSASAGVPHNIILGSSGSGGPFSGFTKRTADKQVPNWDTSKYGASISTSTIVHELGHHLDRRLGLTPGSSNKGNFSTFMKQEFGINPTNWISFDSVIKENGSWSTMTYGANKSLNRDEWAAESFADHFMTVVLDGQGYYDNRPDWKIGWDAGSNAEKAVDAYLKSIITVN